MRIEKEFKQKPIVVNAVQFNHDSIRECEDFCGRYIDYEQREGIGAGAHFIRREGRTYILRFGDWIIRDGIGLYRVMSNSDFEKHYELNQ